MHTHPNYRCGSAYIPLEEETAAAAPAEVAKVPRARTAPLTAAGLATKAEAVETARANSPAVVRGDGVICRVTNTAKKKNKIIKTLTNGIFPGDIAVQRA